MPTFPRISYGQEVHRSAVWPDPCRDCGVTNGAYHLRHCCMEACPKCLHGQKLTCDLTGCTPCDCDTWESDA
jgi:hypothetical protein